MKRPVKRAENYFSGKKVACHPFQPVQKNFLFENSFTIMKKYRFKK